MSKNIKEIEVKVSGKEWVEFLNNATSTTVGKVTIPGFRKGKAPRDKVFNKYKQDIILDAADNALQKKYTEVLKENNDFEIITEPKVEFLKVDEKSAEFKIILTGKPEVTLGKYKDLKVTKGEVKVTRKEIEDVIEKMQSKYAEIKDKTTELKTGDTVIINFKGLKDGVAFEGGTAENYSLELGSNTFIPGFEEQLIGFKKGDKVTVDVTFPKDYHSKDLKGEKVIFEVEILETKETTIPKLGKEFYDDLGLPGVEDKKTLETEVENNIKVQKGNDNENKYLDELLKEAGKTTKVDIPEELIKEEENRMIGQYEENLKLQGLTLEQFYQFTSSDELALREQMKEESGNRVKYRLMLEEIIRVEKIVISDAKVGEEATKLAVKYQMDEEEFKKAFGGLSMVKYDLEMREAINIIKGDKK